jgi:hypothetical protein
MADHDHLFKELITEFFPEFIDLFFPQIAAYLDPSVLEFQPQEIFADLAQGNTYAADIVVKTKFRRQDSFFIVHFEHQGQFHGRFDWRVFNYFSQLHRIYQLPVYPIVLFSHRSPRTAGKATTGEIRSYRVEFEDLQVLNFNYRMIRLNHLPWQSYAEQHNPVASALMSKMKIKREERPQAKLACLRLMSQLRLNPAQAKLISGFVDTYLRLTPVENDVFLSELAGIEKSEKEGVMEVVTSWMQEGIEQEVAALLTAKYGELTPNLAGAIPTLLKLEPIERAQLILQSSQEELLAQVQAESSGN